MLLSCGGGSGSPNNPVTPPDTPPTCADFLAQRRTAAVLFHKLEVKRAFQAKAAARSRRGDPTQGTATEALWCERHIRGGMRADTTR